MLLKNIMHYKKAERALKTVVFDENDKILTIGLTKIALYCIIKVNFD